MASKQLKFLKNYERSCERFRTRLPPHAHSIRLPPGGARRRARRAGRCDGAVIGDGLASQHTHADAFRGHADIDRQGSKSRTPDHVVFAGDSAAGGLALAFAQSLPTLDLPQPVKLVFFAPWLDITLANPAIPDVERHDRWLSSAGLSVAGRAWAGTTDLDDPAVSPIYGPMGSRPSRSTSAPATCSCRIAGSFATASPPPTAQIDRHEIDGAFHVYVLILSPRAAGTRIGSSTTFAGPSRRWWLAAVARSERCSSQMPGLVATVAAESVVWVEPGRGWP